MKIFLIIIPCLLMLKTVGQILPTSEIIQRTFNLRYNSSTATCFMIKEKGKNFFVTAKHVFPTKIEADTVNFEIHQDTSWQKIYGKIYFHTNPAVDVVVVELLHSTKVFDTIQLKNIPFNVGQQGLFLGFPLGIENVAGYFINDNFPLPLVKAAFFSGILRLNNFDSYLFDGHNNPGFSGGPVIFKNSFDHNDTLPHVVAVVSAYINQPNRITTNNGIFTFNENSGILIGIPISYVLEILNRNFPKEK